VRLSRAATVADLSHQDFVCEIHRAVEAAELPVVRGNRTQTPFRIAAGLYLPKGYTSKAEYVDMELAEPVVRGHFCKKLAEALPEGIDVIWAKRIPASAPHLRASYAEICYTVFGVFDSLSADIFRDQSPLIVVRRKHDKEKTVDVKASLSEFQLLENGIRFSLRIGPEGNPSPEEVVLAVSKVSERDLVDYRFERTDVRLLPIGFPRSFLVE